MQKEIRYSVAAVILGDEDARTALGQIQAQAPEFAWFEPATPQEVPASDPDVIIILSSDLEHAESWLRGWRDVEGDVDGESLPIVVWCLNEFDGDALPREVGSTDDIWVAPQREGLGRRLRAFAKLGRNSRALDNVRSDAAILIELTGSLTSSLDTHEILHTVVNRVAATVNFARVSIVLAPTPQANDVGYVLASSDDESVTNLKLDLQKYPEIREVLQTGSPLFIEDAQAHPLLEPVRAGTSGVGTMALFPIAWEGETLGVLFLRSHQPGHQLMERMLYFCTLISRTTGIALRNARILEALRDHTQEITVAKSEAEKQLRSLERYAALFNSAAEGIAVIDADGLLLFANPRGYEIAGAALESLEGRKLIDWVAPEDQERVRAVWHGIQRGEYRRGIDIALLNESSERVRCCCSFAPLADQPSSTLISFSDVTAQRRTEEQFRRTKEFLEGLINASVDGIIAADMEGKVLLFNPGAERLYDLKAEDVVGKMNVRELYRGRDAFFVMERLRSEEFGGEGRLGPIRLDIRNLSGALIPISLTAAVIYDDGKPIASFGIFTDLRDRVRVEERLAHTQKKLEISEKQALIAEVAGTTAHELNQPLTSITAYCDLLIRRLDAESSEYRAASIISEETERMAEIVRKIGKMTRYETTSYVGDQRIIDLERASKTNPPPPFEGS